MFREQGLILADSLTWQTRAWFSQGIGVNTMTGIEYLCGMALLLLGLNVGFYEARKGLKLKELQELIKPVKGKAGK